MILKDAFALMDRIIHLAQTFVNASHYNFFLDKVSLILNLQKSNTALYFR